MNQKPQQPHPFTHTLTNIRPVMYQTLQTVYSPSRKSPRDEFV
jgi:hypothetical protein